MKNLPVLILSLIAYPLSLYSGTLQVLGEASRRVPPDTIVCSFEITAEDPLAAKAASDFAARHDEAVRQLVASGFASNEVVMSSIEMAPRFESEGSWNSKHGGSGHVFKGYRYSAHHTVTFPFDRTRLSALYAALIGCETVPAFRVNFTCRNSAPVERELRAESVQNAIQKAEGYAKAFGVSLTELKSAKEGGEVNWHESDDLSYEAAPMSARNVAPVPRFSELTPQDILVTSRVAVTFQTK